jgi:membrane-associated phospholipid phosphatase
MENLKDLFSMSLWNLRNLRRYDQGYLGWHLVIGLLIFAAMTLILGEISEDVMNGEPLTIADLQISNWLHTHRSPRLTTVFLIVTSFGSTTPVILIAIIVGLYLLWRRQPYWLAAIWSSVFGGMLLNKYLKLVFYRPRPLFNNPILAFTGYSFPSGHTMAATVLYGVLAVFLVATINRRSYRVLVVLVASCLIGLVGFSRMYLGAHYLSDVVGAIAEGLAWMSLCLTTVYSVWRHRRK